MRNSVYIFYEHTARSAELDEEIEERDSPMSLKIINKIHRQTGLYYYGVRYYNPSISIFISVDPLVEQTMDAYGYTYQNPINLVDPTGMAAEGNCPNCDTPINEDAPIMLNDIVIEGFKNKEYESPRLQYSYNETYSRRFAQLQSRVNEDFTIHHARIWADYYGQISVYYEQSEMNAYQQRQSEYWDEKGKYLAYGTVGAVITPSIIVTGIIASPALISAYGTTSTVMTNWGINIAVKGASTSTFHLNIVKQKIIERASIIYMQHGSKGLKHFLYGKGAHDYIKGIYGNQVTVSPEQFATALDAVFHFITSQSLGVPTKAIKPNPK